MKKKYNNTKKILAIGPRVQSESGNVTGPSMMFDLLMKALETSTWETDIVNIVDENSLAENRKVGGFSRSRMLFYIKLLPKICKKLFIRQNLVYMIIAPTLAAFIRDAVVIWAAYFLRHRIVCQLFGDYQSFYNGQNTLIKKFISITLSRPDKIIVEGQLVKSYMAFIRSYEDSVIPISNGLPEVDVKSLISCKKIANDSSYNLLYMGNMIETKGYLDVLQAVNILVNERGRKINAKFAGKFIVTEDAVKFSCPDDARNYFLSYLKNNNLEKNVSYSKAILGEEKRSEFEKAHFFLLPSNYIFEMQPVSVLEAMAYGAVVIGTDHKLIPDMLQDGVTGSIVPYNSPDSIADKIEYLIDNPEIFESFSQNSINMYNLKFSPDIYCGNVIKVFDQVTN